MEEHKQLVTQVDKKDLNLCKHFQIKTSYIMKILMGFSQNTFFSSPAHIFVDL
jgi:hypothetical protein